MNCTVAHQVMDSYLENRLSRYERQRLETHLLSCATCAEEMGSRSSLERAIGQALSAVVQHRVLPPGATAEMIEGAQAAVRRSLWSKRIGLSLQIVTASAAVALVVFGLVLWQAGIPISSTIDRIPLAPVRQFFATEISPASDLPVETLPFLDPQPVSFSSETQAGLSLTRGESLVQPAGLRPGERFTITALLESELPQELDSVHLELGITGPTGYFDFTLVVRGPFRAQSVSVLQVTPAELARPCQEKYLVAPTDIFGLPGRYLVRVALSIPSDSAGR